MEGVNLVSVLAGSLIAIALGFIWYSPLMFGNVWIRILKLDRLSKKEMSKDMPLTMSFMVFNTITVGYILNILLQSMGTVDLFGSYFMTAVLWATLVGGVLVSNGLFSKTRKKVILIDAGYRLVMLLVFTTTYLLIGY